MGMTSESRNTEEQREKSAALLALRKRQSECGFTSKFCYRGEGCGAGWGWGVGGVLVSSCLVGVDRSHI